MLICRPHFHMSKPISKPFIAALPIITLCFFALLLMWRPLVRGDVFLPLDALLHLHPWRYSYERVAVNNPINTDPIKQVYPRRLIANDILQQGALPLWNSTVLTGNPFLPDGQLALFYPPSLLFLIIPLARAFSYYAFLQVALAGIGSYLFARQLKLGRAASTLVGTCFMFNGYLLTWLQFPHHTGAVAMLPWCFWAVDRACERVRARWWALAGVVLAMPVLSHLQLAFYIYVGVGCYVLMRIVQSEGWRARLRLILGFGGALLIALALSAVQLLPAIELAAQGQRGDLGFDFGSPDNQFMSLLRLAMPLLTGSPRGDGPPAWGAPLFAVPMPYAGLVPLLLALLALIMSRHSASLFFGLLAIGSFALALSSPLLQVFMFLVPPYRQFEDHTRWFVLWGFAVSVLAGMGLQALLWRSEPALPGTRRIAIANRLLLGATLLFLLVWSWQYMQLFTPQSKYATYSTLIRQQPLGVSLAIGGAAVVALALLRVRRLPQILTTSLVLALVAVDILWHNGGYNTSVSTSIIKPTTDLTSGLSAYPAAQTSSVLYPPTRQTAFLQSQPGPFRILGGDYLAIPPNLASAYGIEDIRGYVSLYSARYNRLVRLIDGKDYSKTSERDISFRAYFTSAYSHRRLLDMLNVEFFVFPPESQNAPLYAPLELVQKDDEGTIYRNPQALPRAWLVHQVEVIEDDQAQLERLADPHFDPAATAILASGAPATAPATAPEAPPTVVYAPNQAQVRVTVTAPAMLVLSDAYSDDWRVTVDGQDAPLYRANYVLRGVWLPPGAHVVEFTYRPRSVLLGGGISIAGILALAGYGMWEWRRESAQRPG
jgi:hypothetical protein